MFKRSLPVAIALIIPNLLSAQAPRMAKTARDIYKLAGPSVVLIESYGDDGKVSGTGSGFLVSADNPYEFPCDRAHQARNGEIGQ